MRNMFGIEMINGVASRGGVTPFQDSDDVVGETQGDALGYGVRHRWCDIYSAPMVHPSASPGQRPGFLSRPWINALKGRNPEADDHFVGVNKMTPATLSLNPLAPNNEARELEARIAENVAEILETA